MEEREARPGGKGTRADIDAESGNGDEQEELGLGDEVIERNKSFPTSY